MNNYIKLLVTDLKRLWAGLDINQKFMVAALTLVTIIAGTYFIIKATEPNWAVLYADLGEKDVVSITESLKKSGYAYKISDDKKAVLVPASQKEDLRMFVAENDLIQDSSPGFELLDELQLGSTDFKNKLTKQRIFQGELTRSIERINGVQKARVQLAEPERSIFADKDESPTASVVLILEPGYRIKSSQVMAIKNIVAYAVPRLAPDKVFITDQNGEVLSDDTSKNSSDIESFRANFEQQAAKKIKSVLETIMGKDNVTVQVSADLDFNSAKSTIESYAPVTDSGEGIVMSSQTEREQYDNPNVQAQQSQTPAELVDQKKNISYTKEKNATNYGVTKEIKQVIYAPGSVKRMTVAVAVNKVLTPKEKEEIEELSKAAAGVDFERGDVINVTSLKFTSLETDKQEYEALVKENERTSMIEFIISKVGPLAVVFILGIMAITTFGSLFRRQDNQAKGYIEAMQAFPVPDSSNNTYQGEDDDLAGADDFLVQFNTQISQNLEKKKNELAESVMADPTEAARLLISYIKE